MGHIREGSQVSYVGYGEGGLAVGDQGRVLAASGDHSHVRWTTGAAEGQVLLVANDDLVQATARREEDTDIFAGPLVSLAVRDIYDAEGEVGLLNAMADAGHLAGFAQIAEETLEWVQGKVASDPSVADALAHLEPEEQMETLSFLTASLLRDAFGREDG